MCVSSNVSKILDFSGFRLWVVMKVDWGVLAFFTRLVRLGVFAF